jgi:hypothetical protein
MYKSKSIENLWDLLLKKALMSSIQSALNSVKAFKQSTIMDMARISFNAWKALGEGCLQMLCQPYSDALKSNLFLEAAKVWPQVTYFLSKFLSGKIQIASKQIYLPRLSLVYSRPIFETTFRNIENIMYEDAVKAADNNIDRLESILDNFYSEIDPAFKTLTMEVNSNVKKIMDSSQTRIDAYCNKMNSIYRKKSNIEIPGICNICFKLFTDSKNFSCCATAKFSNCRSHAYKEYRTRCCFICFHIYLFKTFMSIISNE